MKKMESEEKELIKEAGNWKKTKEKNVEIESEKKWNNNEK